MEKQAPADNIHCNKVARVTFLFWLIKIAATTLGETGGDAVSMSLDLGYLAGSAIFLGFFITVLAVQMNVRTYHPFLYWLVIVATTTLGTTMADFADRSLGIGYMGGSIMVFLMLMATLVLWYWSVGSISVANIVTRKAEIFYWVAILFSNTLGTALGDFTADSPGIGYEKAALGFSAGLALIAALYYRTKISHALLFWAAFILTRPLGAVLGDLLTKPHEDGGLALDRFHSTAVIAVFMVACILHASRKAQDAPK